MKLETHPLIINGVFFFQTVDNALADITEGSNIVGKYFKVDHHSIPLKNLVEYTLDSRLLQIIFMRKGLNIATFLNGFLDTGLRRCDDCD